jgi:predicted acyl esterase
MDTCGLERVERFRINLNEKNFASQKNTLTSSLPKDAEPLAPTAAATIRLSMYLTSVLLRKGHRIRVTLARADGSLFEPYPAEGS